VGALAGLAVATTRNRGGQLRGLDEKITSLVVGRRSPAAIRAAHAISALAEPAAAAVPLTVSALVAVRRNGWPAAAIPCLTVITGMTIRRRLSRLIARPRPPAANWLIEPEGFSLPSKHTTLAALTAGACALALGARRPARDRVAISTAAGIGASRICLGVHWPSDVVAGWLFAAAWLDLASALPPADHQSPTAPTAGLTGRTLP
jgi:membrane-associated phospholipid phosphatase